jgi:hypothetical protein
VIRDHLLGKFLLVCIAFLLGDLGGFNLQHLAGSSFLDEVLRLGRDPERRVEAGLLAERLRESRRGESGHEGHTKEEQDRNHKAEAPAPLYIVPKKEPPPLPAYEEVLRALTLANRSDPITQLFAKPVFETFQTGVLASLL